MEKKLSTVVLERVRKYLSGNATYRIAVTLEKDVNEFALEILPLTKTPLFKITESDVVAKIMPVGSSWKAGLGWHSYFGIPLELQGCQVLALGVAEIVPNPFGGASPLVESYLFPFPSKDPLAGLSRLIQELGTTSKDSIKYRRGIIQANSETVKEHVPIEVDILFNAIQSYSKALEDAKKFQSVGWFQKAFRQVFDIKPALYFQTLLLSEDELAREDLPGPNWLGVRSGYLLATIPDFLKNYSFSNKVTISLSTTSRLQDLT